LTEIFAGAFLFTIIPENRLFGLGAGFRIELNTFEEVLGTEADVVGISSYSSSSSDLNMLRLEKPM
jgi:hypothetical protein